MLCASFFVQEGSSSLQERAHMAEVARPLEALFSVFNTRTGKCLPFFICTDLEAVTYDLNEAWLSVYRKIHPFVSCGMYG